MSEAIPPGTPAPAATPAPAPTPPVPAAAAPTPAPAPEGDPAWLGDRLKRNEQQLLTKLGVTNLEEAQKAIEAAKKAADAEKSAADRAAELATQLNTSKADADRLRGVTTEHAGRMMAVLTAERQAAVKAIAGDDPAQQLNVIGAMAPTWGAADQAAAAAAAPPAPTPPATTAPAPNAPAPASTGAQPDPTQVYQQLRTDNPFAAAAYGVAHMRDVYKTPS